MRCENRASIPGSLADIMAVATPVERWALLLPASYQWVRYHGRGGGGAVFQFAAWRGPLPVRWTAEQIVFPDERRIVYRHLRGLTSGLWSEWRFAPVGESVEVSVCHEWRHPLPVVGEPLALLVGALWVRPLTQATLAGLADAVRSGRAAALRRLNEAQQQRAAAGAAGDGDATRR
jgi:hypothetical protein